MLKLAWRGIRNEPRFSLLFALNLTLGLLGFCILDSFKVALDQNLEARSKNLLSADLSVSARRQLTPDEERIIGAILPPGTETGRMIAMYSMVSSPRSSRLVELDAIDSTYPFYGHILLNDGKTIVSGGERQILGAPVAWTYPELAVELGLKPGDELKLGEARFKITNFIADDTGNAWRDISLGPRVYIGLPFLESTRLLTRGSTAYFYRLYRLPEGTDAEAVARKIDRALTDPAVAVKTHRKASEEIGRLLDYLGDYLGLVAMVAIFLAGVGAAYLLRSFLAQRTREVAILSSLGVSHREIRNTYLFQQAILGSFASALALAIAAAVLPGLGALVQGILEARLRLEPSLRTIALTWLIGGAGSVLIAFPLLLRLKELKPNLLFQESATPTLRFTLKNAAGLLPALVAFWALAIWQAHSLKTGSLFLGALLGSGAVLGGAGAMLLSLLARLRLASVSCRLAFRNLLRNPIASISCLAAIGLGCLLLNLIPEIQSNIASEFERPPGEETPDLFLWDVQEDQLESLKAFLKEKGLASVQFAPLIRARLETVNGAPFEKSVESSKFQTREEEREARTRNRGFNLSYRAGLSSAETLFAGRALRTTPPSDGVAEVSVERRFAERMGMKLGDELSFDVQGVPVKARIVALRKVRWTSFQPNFFVIFQPGVLEDAPKTFIASIPKIGSGKLALQDAIVNKFPNISIFDVDRVVRKILGIVSEMSFAIQVMAYLCLAVGLLVLFSIAHHQANLRAPEINLLKVLGTGFGEIHAMVRLEFGLLALAGAGVGAGLSYLVSYLISVVLFDGVWVWSWRFQLASVGLVTLLAVWISSHAAARVLRMKPLDLLGAAG